jgi:hypothetical protein
MYSTIWVHYLILQKIHGFVMHAQQLLDGTNTSSWERPDLQRQ